MIIEKYKKQVAEFILKHFNLDQDKYTNIFDSIEFPPNPDMGDLAVPMFAFAKQLQKSPIVLAQELSDAFHSDDFDRIQATGPYINFFVKKDKYVSDVLSSKLSFPKIDQKIMIEYMSANPNKPLHIGQARNVCIGDTLVRIFRFMGYHTHGVNYGDDSGVNVGYNILGHTQYGYPLDTNNKFDHYCGEIYTKMRKNEEDEQFKKALSQVLLEIEKGTNPEISKLQYEYTRKCLYGQLQSCWRIGAYFDLVNWETDILHLHFFEKALEMLKSKSYVHLATEGEAKGCWIIDLASLPEFADAEKKYQILVKSDGVATYVGKDIAYAMWKLGYLGKDFYYHKLFDQPNGLELISTSSDVSQTAKYGFGDYNHAIAVIDNRQSFAQSVVKGSLTLLDMIKSDKIYEHLSYGMVNITPSTLEKFGYAITDEERAQKFLGFSSRKGRFITIDETLDTMVNKVYEETKSKNPEKNDDWILQTSEKIAVGAFRFFLIKADLDKEVVFDINDVLSLEGETGVYIIYSYARIFNIFEKLGLNLDNISNDFDASLLSEDIEFEIIKKIDDLDRIIILAKDNLEPNLLARYMFEFAQMLNSYYAKVKIISAPDDVKAARLAFLRQSIQTLGKAMDLVGIPRVERM